MNVPGLRPSEPGIIVEVMRDIVECYGARRRCHPTAKHRDLARALLLLGCASLRRAGADYAGFVAEVAGAWEASGKIGGIDRAMTIEVDDGDY